MEEFLIVQTTFENRKDAEELSAVITKERLAACGQIDGPIHSIYWWKETLEKEEEWRCSLKTTKKLFKKIESRIRELHPYETPEIVAIPIIDGSKAYLDWLKKEVKE